MSLYAHLGHWEDSEVLEPEPHDVDVERELIREANERSARVAMLECLKAYLEQVRLAYERAKKASSK